MTSLKTVECFDYVTERWSPVTSMSRPRSAAGVTYFGDRIYCFGGHDGLNIFDSGEYYDAQSQQWTMVAPMLNKRCRLGVATLGGKIYVAGKIHYFFDAY